MRQSAFRHLAQFAFTSCRVGRKAQAGSEGNLPAGQRQERTSGHVVSHPGETEELTNSGQAESRRYAVAASASLSDIIAVSSLWMAVDARWSRLRPRQRTCVTSPRLPSP
jgi:hypothetical protein